MTQDSTKQYDAALKQIHAHSPYLSRLLEKEAGLLEHCASRGAAPCFAAILDEMHAGVSASSVFEQAQVMQHLRRAKMKVALLTALVDLSGAANLAEITQMLSDFAEAALAHAVDWLLKAAVARGDLAYEGGSGLIVLGMGKLGARELNYSSDIDLIILFDAEKLTAPGRLPLQKVMNRIAQDLVHIMQERTPDGYVFRTDLRLRPDPASTPPAVSMIAAYNYYESVGQNWERAAMIKAKPVAGDFVAGAQFVEGLRPYIWRRSLDFASIQDIHSIKRQMDARGSGTITLPAHNIKIGRGGIREIEFFVQIHQLIWGGREPRLRVRGTCEALSVITSLGLITEETRRTLFDAYEYLRTLEHRLQMVQDEQTHTLPATEAGLVAIAQFMGFATLPAFAERTLAVLHEVHSIFSASFRSSAELGDAGNLVFTGVTHDPDTIKTLANMGYQQPEMVSETIMGWHHGSRRSTRTKRARELLTELMPVILKRLSETASPDAALLNFHEFLGQLPAAIQLFSLFQARPQLLELIAEIMGSAPALAESLSRKPALLDEVLLGGFFTTLATREQLSQQLQERLLQAAEDEELAFELLRQFQQEKQFQAGVQLLKQTISPEVCGAFLSSLADVVLQAAYDVAMTHFSKGYGVIPGARFCILGLGRLGSNELTFGSDLDLVFVYDVPDFEALSTGEKSFTASVYYNRFAQRLLNLLTASGREGRLYEVDTRLRPSGKQGLLAVSFQALTHYFAELAWTFEEMAFTKARPAAGDSTLALELSAFVQAVLTHPRDHAKLKKEVGEMRARVEAEHVDASPWQLKHARGGLMDIDFLVQYWILRFASECPELSAGSAIMALRALAGKAKISAPDAELLLEAAVFFASLFHYLRLTGQDAQKMPLLNVGVCSLMLRVFQETSAEMLERRVIALEEAVRRVYDGVFK